MIEGATFRTLDPCVIFPCISWLLSSGDIWNCMGGLQPGPSLELMPRVSGRSHPSRLPHWMALSCCLVVINLGMSFYACLINMITAANNMIPTREPGMGER